MKDLTTCDSDVQIRDDIDRIVATILADPERAEDMKALLRLKMVAPEVLAAVPDVPVARRPAPEPDVDDLWDNMPV